MRFPYFPEELKTLPLSIPNPLPLISELYPLLTDVNQHDLFHGFILSNMVFAKEICFIYCNMFMFFLRYEYVCMSFSMYYELFSLCLIYIKRL